MHRRSIDHAPLVLGLLALALPLLAACPHDLAPTADTSGCPGPCPVGTSCDPVSGVCVRPHSLPYEDKGCLPPEIACGRVCADLTRDPDHCGACGQSCGPNAACAGACRCQEGFADCNGSWFDGCECQGTCDAGGRCASSTSGPAPACDPTIGGACGDDDGYCDEHHTCQGCPAGFRNCDGELGCECQGTCDAGRCTGPASCSPAQPNACGGETAYCESNARECTACPAGTRNCDGTYGCEQAGSSCSPVVWDPVGECSYHDANVCGGAEDKWCGSIGDCRSCSAGFFNCDRTQGCECKHGCNGTQCADCDKAVAFSCGAATTEQWCYEGQCRGCSDGYSNCDGKAGCECKYGCNGTQCADCDKAVAFSCGQGTERLWCDGGRCDSCKPGYFNCNGKAGCECKHGCDGTQCADCSATVAFTCEGPNQFCDTGRCESCKSGSANCDGKAGCECKGVCDGTQCVPSA